MAGHDVDAATPMPVQIDQAIRNVEGAITQVAIQIHVDRHRQRERLAAVRLKDRSDLPAAEPAAQTAARIAPERQIPNQRCREAMAHVEIGARPLGAIVVLVLRENRRTGNRKHVRYVINRVRQGVSRRELQAFAVTLAGFELQGVIIRCGRVLINLVRAEIGFRPLCQPAADERRKDQRRAYRHVID